MGLSSRECALLSASTHAIGLDVGLHPLYTLSTGEHVPCPKFLRTNEKDVKRMQRKLSAAPKGTPEHAKRRKIAAWVHERIAHRYTGRQYVSVNPAMPRKTVASMATDSDSRCPSAWIIARVVVCRWTVTTMRP